MSFDLRTWMERAREEVEAALSQTLDAYLGEVPEQLNEAMRYSLLAGGKRLRPLVVLAAAEAFAGAASRDNPAVMDAAIAIELYRYLFPKDNVDFKYHGYFEDLYH